MLVLKHGCCWRGCSQQQCQFQALISKFERLATALARLHTAALPLLALKNKRGLTFGACAHLLKLLCLQETMHVSEEQAKHVLAVRREWLREVGVLMAERQSLLARLEVR